jgi:hypothetical protein
LSEAHFVVAAIVAASWGGTVIVDGMIHEPSGYHPYRRRSVCAFASPSAWPLPAASACRS